MAARQISHPNLKTPRYSTNEPIFSLQPPSNTSVARTDLLGLLQYLLLRTDGRKVGKCEARRILWDKEEVSHVHK